MLNTLIRGIIMMSLLPILMTPQDAVASSTEKPAIVLAAFGTSVDQAREVFDHIDARVRQRYPEYDVRWAFTSQIIIDKLKKRGIETRNVQDVVTDLRRAGVRKVAFQSLHVVPGQEYKSVHDVDMSGLKVAYGDALITSDEDIAAVIQALDKHIDPEKPAVVVAHGNDRHPEFNRQLLALAEKIEEQYPRLVVASVEGQPGTGPLEKARDLARESGSVRFIPLMVVAGDHIMNDVLGDEPDSWKNIVAADESECTESLGWNDAIIEIYLRHLDKALSSLNAGSD